MTETQDKTDTADVIAPAADTGELVLAADQTWWTARQLAALEQMGVAGASQGDLLVFHHVVKRTGLDPFARQIYMIGRKQRELVNGEWQTVIKQTIQTGIDGFRLIADRGDHRDGTTREYEDTLWCGKDGVWRDVWVDKLPPYAAKVTVLRDGRRFPAVAVYEEYVQRKQNGDPNSMWERMPSNQLAKCAETLALRKAYPQDLSGLYVDDEMGQADSDRDDAPTTVRRAAPAGGVREAMRRQREQAQATAEQVKATRQEIVGDDEPVVDGDVMLDPRGALAQSVNRAFRDADITDKAERIAFATQSLGRDITKVSDMTEAEVPVLLAAIAQYAAGETPAESGPDAPVDPEQEHADIIAAELAREEKTDG